MAEPILDQGSWYKQPFLVNLRATKKSQYRTLEQVLKDRMAPGADPRDNRNLDIVQQVLDASKTPESSKIMDNAYLSDTRMGWNDAINSLNQFNEDDDLLYPIYQSDPEFGLGRVYAEMIEQHQSILWMSFGVPVYSGLVNFLANAVDTNLTTVMRTGGGSDNILSGVVGLIGDAVSFIIRFPVVALRWMSNSLRHGNIVSSSKYYDFKTTMPMYYQFVQSILIELATNMGFFNAFTTDANEVFDKAPSMREESFPKFLQKNLCDVYLLMHSRASYKYHSNSLPNADSNVELMIKALQANFKSQNALDESYKKAKYDKDTGKVKIDSADLKDINSNMSFVEGVKDTMFGALEYIGFRVEKGTEMNETFSNRTGESSFAQTLNSNASEAMDRSFVAAGAMESLDTGTFGLLSTVIDTVKGFVSKVGGGTVLNNFLGGSFIDIPHVYQGSDFSTSQSFDMELIAGDGSNISIFQDLFFPLAFWLAGTLPRATGDSSYTHPFYCRCYCKGQFAVPLGMITNLSISRGDSEFGWNLQMLPTRLRISVTITDLAPAMYMGMHGVQGGVFDKMKSILLQNSTFREYLNTLSGLGLSERTLFSKTMQRRMQQLSSTLRNTYGNPLWWATNIGDSSLFRGISNILPGDSLPRN